MSIIDKHLKIELLSHNQNFIKKKKSYVIISTLSFTPTKKHRKLQNTYEQNAS